MIVLGNAVDSRAIYALSTRFPARSNHVWPGGDRFCNRAVLEPFRRNVNHILLEASTLAGLKAAVDSFGARIASLEGEKPAVPYFRDLGAATGEWKEKPFKRSGLDLSKSLADIKEQILEKYGKTTIVRPGGVYCYPAWDWQNGYSIEAAKYASAVLLILLDRYGPDRFYNGHYNFDRAFKAWQICFTSGAVPERVINRVEATMVQQAAYPRDYHASSLRTHDGKRIARHADRHMISSLSNYLCGTDYVLSHCRLNPMTEAMISEYDRAYRRIARRFIDSFRCNNVTSESGDSAVCVLNMMALTGNLEYVRGGALGRAVENLVASVNNFGNYTGEGPYIGSYTLTSRCTGRSLANAAAFYYRDPRYRWVARHVKAQACCVAHENAVFEQAGAEQHPDQYLGVRALPFDARIFRALETPEPLPGNWGGMKCVPTGLPAEDLFDRAFFRDSFEPQDAFLGLMGTQLTSSHQMLHSNAIIQYTDLGKILLYTHAQLTDGWVRNTLSASNGRPAKPTFACLRKALINSEDVSAISSVCPNNGNTEWTRTLIHRRGHYFVALDRADALDEGDYTFTCRWRTLFPQQLRDGICTVDAGDGVALNISSADPVLQNSVRTEPDGTTRPYLLSQYQKANLQRGDGVSFKNLFYARGPERPDRCQVRAAGTNCVLVHGKGNDWEEIALIGTGTSPEALTSLKIEADIFYATATQVVAANCRKLEIMGTSALPPDKVGENTTVSLDRAEVGAELAAFFAGLNPPGAVAAETTQNHGFREEWVSDELVYPQVHCTPVHIASQPVAAGTPIEDLTGGLQRLSLKKARHMSHWRTPGKPVEITLDLGRVQSISEFHFIGPIADNYRTKLYYQAGDVRFSVAYSNDSFKDDIRNVPAPEVEFQEQTFPYAQYTWAGRLPLFVVKADVKARFIRISAVTDKPALAFQKLFVVGKKTQPELFCDLQAADLDGDGASELVGKTTNGEIFAMDATGKKMWSRLFPGVVTAWNAVDLENDARQEVLVYTTEDACYALAGDGKERWRVDFYEHARKQNPEAWGRDWSKYCLSFVTAWRPDAKTNRKEVFGFGHTTVTGIRPDLAIDSTIGSGHVNKFAVSDTSVLGREVLAGGGFNFTLLDRSRKTIAKVPMPGRLAGN
ncbi:MAG: hypothetical protein HN849_22155, partial [Victivallales bacterium]|nr:hypothetical protein [Victivallales bacterium]